MTTNLTNDTRLSDLNKTVKALGAKSAHWALAKPQMALAIAQARADGVIDDNAGAATYDTYLDGRKGVLSKSHLGSGAEDGGSYKANVSKNTQILKAAGLVATGVDFLDVMTRATDIREQLLGSSEKVKAPFDAYVDLARAQLKEPTAALSDDAITGIVRKKAAAEKEIVDKIIDAYKKAHKLNEEFPCAPLAAAVQDLSDAIIEAGGDVPAVTKDEKEAAKAMAFLTSRGFAVQVNSNL